MMFIEDDVKKVVDEVVSMPVFEVGCRSKYMEGCDYIGLLTVFMNDFNEFLVDFLDGTTIEDMDANQFVDAVHNFFAFGYTTKDGEREYSFAYDGNSGGNYKPEDTEALVANSGNKRKILSHTFMSLMIPGKNGERRAICSGYTELAGIVGKLYGYECVPLIAMCQIEDGPKYEFAHYLCALDDDGKPILIDLQQINTQKRKVVGGENLQMSDLFEKAKQRMHDFHCNLLFINPNTMEFATFNENKLIHGGLGEDVIKAVRETIEKGNTELLSFVFDSKNEAPKGIANVIDVQKIEGGRTLSDALLKIVGNKEKKV